MRPALDTARASLANRRLGVQQIARPQFATPAEVVAWLGALQAQDYGAAKWAVGLRLPEGAATDASIERALADGAVLRTHALRGTWQLVAPADIRWILGLVAGRIVASYASRYRELQLDAGTFRRSNATLARALRGGAHLTRAELVAALEDAGVSTAGQRLAFLLQRAELEALICSGARRSKQFTYALLDQRAPNPHTRLERDEAIAELARRYFRSRGPATADDFSWWSGLTASDAKGGLTAIKSTLVSEVIGGKTYWRSDGRSVRPAAPIAHVLPAFDEYLVAYRDRAAVLDPKHVTAVNAGGGMLGPCVVLDGRVAGTWRRALARTTVAIEVDLFEALTRRQQQAVAVAARHYAAFVGLEAKISASVRRREQQRRQQPRREIGHHRQDLTRRALSVRKHSTI